MRNELKQSGAWLAMLLLGMLLLSCEGQKGAPEDEIRQYIKRGVEAAEDRSASDLGDMMHDSYLGQKGLDKRNIVKLLRGYFFRHKNIFLFTRIREISFPSEVDARVVLYVAMAGSVISDASVLSRLRARMYRFELQLVKEDEWLLKSASWQPASAADMQ